MEDIAMTLRKTAIAFALGVLLQMPGVLFANDPSTAPAFLESKLPESVRHELKKIRAKAIGERDEWYWAHVGVPKKKAASIVKPLGPLASQGTRTVYGFYERQPMAFACDGTTHFVLYDEALSQTARTLNEVLLHIRVEGFFPEDRVAWFEDFGGLTEPLLAIRQQQHNGTWNIRGTAYLRVKDDLSTAPAFTLVEVQEDRIANRHFDDPPGQASGVPKGTDWRCFDLVSASVRARRDKDGTQRLVWEQRVGCKDRRFVAIRGDLKLAPDGTFVPVHPKVLWPAYQDIGDPFVESIKWED
jgi:hypothetical protein